MVEMRAEAGRVGAIRVFPAQVAAAKLRVKMAEESGEEVDEAVRAIAAAVRSAASPAVSHRTDASCNVWQSRDDESHPEPVRGRCRRTPGSPVQYLSLAQHGPRQARTARPRPSHEERRPRSAGR